MPGQHPLLPLTEDELRAAAAAIKGDARWTAASRFVALTLREPDKRALIDGLDVPRQAEAVIVDRATGATAEIEVDLAPTAGTPAVCAWTVLKDEHAAYLLEELMNAIGVVKADPRWQAAVRARGVTDLDLVQCDPWPAGRFGIDGEAGKRLARVVSYMRASEGDNGYAHPIEGVVVTVDLVANEVVRFEDHGVVPVPPTHGNYDRESVGQLRDGLKPLDIVQPEGASFTVDGNEVRWQRWRFRVSMHPIDGLVLHTVSHENGGRDRPIMHRAALGEMVVPYGETAPNHRWKNAFDSGELGLGRFPFLNSLELGCDCLGEIHYFDALQVTEQGDPMAVTNAICLHEEDYGILWKHVNLNTFTTEVRRSRRLVVSSIHTVGNYEYGFYWYFYLDGTIQLEVKLTGILQTMAVVPGAVPAHGSLIAPQLAAPHHQHLFNFRLDLDIDGTTNSVHEVELVPAADDDGVEDGNAYGNAMTVVARLLATESEAQRMVEPSRSRHWRISNPDRRNAIGQPVAYRLLPGSAPTLLAREGSPIARRAAFATRNLWVTPHDRTERRAAGYPNLHDGGAGLPAITAGDRSVTDTDVVLWYTFGVNHVARPEDWPVMPVEYAGFTLSPYGFFDRNPALDVPPSSNSHCA